jgi:hypothetical protein
LFGTFSFSAAAEGLWSAQVGLGGLVAPGSWTPLRFQTPDAGPWSVEVRAVSASGREASVITFRHAAGGSFEEPFFLEDATRALNLRFLAGDLVQEEFLLPLTGRLFPGHLIGVHGVSPADEGALSEVLLPGEPVRTLSLPPAQWPTSVFSYGALSALVVRDPGAVLAPAQLSALRVWIASGGRLIVLAPRASGSLFDQVGPVEGLGRVSATTSPRWKDLLGLRPYGEVHRLGTEFAPWSRPASRGDGPGSAALAFVLGWAGLSALWLVLRKKQGLGRPLVAAFLGTLAAGGLWLTGVASWDRGLASHAREIELPGGLGRFAVLQAVRPDERMGPFDWSRSPAWALPLWREGRSEGSMIQSLGHDRVALAAFLPAVPRRASFQVVWEGRLRWFQAANGVWAPREEAPAELTADVPWLAGLAAEHPGLRWSVGLEDGACWVRPETEVSL